MSHLITYWGDSDTLCTQRLLVASPERQTIFVESFQGSQNYFNYFPPSLFLTSNALSPQLVFLIFLFSDPWFFPVLWLSWKGGFLYQQEAKRVAGLLSFHIFTVDTMLLFILPKIVPSFPKLVLITVFFQKESNYFVTWAPLSLWPETIHWFQWGVVLKKEKWRKKNQWHNTAPWHLLSNYTEEIQPWLKNCQTVPNMQSELF